MTIGADMRTDITALIQDLGQDLTFARDSGGAYNPATSVVDGDATASETMRGFFQKYNRGERENGQVEDGDRKLYIAATYNGLALAKTPQLGDVITGEGDEVTIIDLRTIKANASIIAWVCQVRE